MDGNNNNNNNRTDVITFGNMQNTVIVLTDNFDSKWQPLLSNLKFLSTDERNIRYVVAIDDSR